MQYIVYMVSFDSSTLILLAKIDLLGEVLQDIEIVITDIVKIECTVKDTYDAKLINTMISTDRISVERGFAKKEITRIGKDFKINVGEASALLLANKREIPLATDDGLTIKACKILNVPFLTAIHFLLHIYERGVLSDREMALVKMEKLAAFGRYSHRIIESAIGRIKGDN